MKLLNARDIDVEIVAHRGLPRLLKRMTERVGLIVGAALALVLIV
ncbi:MAG: sporulation protein YqfD, partial [Lentisphaeria bacterium]|nr:sporulation protein YqfD [Lentisphaeria bacterium]